jgi:hypothetical protein
MPTVLLGPRRGCRNHPKHSWPGLGQHLQTPYRFRFLLRSSHASLAARVLRGSLPLSLSLSRSLSCPSLAPSPASLSLPAGCRTGKVSSTLHRAAAESLRGAAAISSLGPPRIAPPTGVGTWTGQLKISPSRDGERQGKLPGVGTAHGDSSRARIPRTPHARHRWPRRP